MEIEYYQEIWNIKENKTKPKALQNIDAIFKINTIDCVSKENNTYVGCTTTTLSRRLTMHLNDSSSIALHLKTHSISKFWKILVKNTTIIAHKVNKLQLQILEALHIKPPKN